MSRAEAPAPTFYDLDVRLSPGPARTDRVLTLVIAEHVVSSGQRCTKCGAVVAARRACPSAAVARSIRDQRPLPAWLAHLTVPGVPAPAPTVSVRERRAAEDAAPGLFDAPARVTREAS